MDFNTREVKDNLRQLTMVRIGTSGALQPELTLGTPVIAEKSIGFDGVLNYYAGRDEIADLEFEKAFCEHTNWNPLWAKPYIVDADAELVDRIGGDDMVRGNTISAVGFYGPQGREVRLALANPDLNHLIEEFENWPQGDQLRDGIGSACRTRSPYGTQVHDSLLYNSKPIHQRI